MPDRLPSPGPSWRAGAAVAAAAVLGDPGSWLLGLLGFTARGGLVLLTLPMLTIPSPVLLSILFRGEVGAVGAGQAAGIALAIAGSLSLVLVVGLCLSAYAEVALAERVLTGTDTLELRKGRLPRALSGVERRALVLWVAAVGAVALVPIVVLGTWSTWRLSRLLTDELTTPATSDASLAIRVVSGAVPELLALLLVLALAEVLVSLATRRLMTVTWGVVPGLEPAADDRPVDDGMAAGLSTTGALRCAADGLKRLVRRPLAVLATTAAEWLVLLAIVGGVVVVTAVGWGGAREAVVTIASRPDPIALLAATGMLVSFVAAWLGGLAILGCAAAVRSTLWTVDALG